MQTIKILVLGITGNLAKIKILPAVGQFYALNKDKVNVELLGYSRSKADKTEIAKLITDNGKLDCPPIQLFQGDYESNQVYHELVSSLQKDQKLVVYLAIPPQIFTKFLQNSCPYSSSPIEILIEKPFGQNLDEAKKILAIVDACQMHQKVHFIDHYLFKNSTRLDFESIAKQLDLNTDKLTKINVQALETVDALGRGGYYDDTGAIKDMLVHLYSILNLGGKFFANNLQIQFQSVDSIQKSQYDGYQQDVQSPNSVTETYFKILTKAKVLSANNEKEVKIELESGKKQSAKLTALTMDFEDGQKLIYEIAPNPRIQLWSGEQLLQTIQVANSTNEDHVNVFEDIIAGDYSHFVPHGEVLKSWELYDLVGV